MVVDRRRAGGARRRGRSARAAGALLRDVEVFDVYRARRSARARTSLALRLEFRAPDRTLTEDEVARASREDRRARSPSSSGRELPCARVAVLGASGYAGAIAAMLVHRHPFFELAHVTARSEAGARLDDIHPRTRVPLELEPWDPDAPVRRRRRARLLAARRRPRRPSPRCASAACASSTCRPTSACATAAIYEDWYGEHGAPELFGAGRLRADRAAPRARSPAPTSSPTPAATRPRRCSRSRRSRAPG